MRRVVVLAALLCVLTAGCVYPTGDPPPYPQPSFEYEYVADGGATALRITVVDPGGLTTEPVRILVGEQIAYANGSFRPPYTDSRSFENEWAGGLETGDSITVSNGSSLGDEVVIQLRRQDTGEYVTVGGRYGPHPPTSDSSSSR